MTKKARTTKIGQFNYAKVSDRLLLFRQDNPRGSIETKPTINEEGDVMFSAHIVKDKAQEHSAEATGHALSKEVKGKDKIFEKTETIAVGRALALLGYGADGEIASSEEMEEFEAHKREQFKKEVEEYKKQLGKVCSLKSLGEAWAILPTEVKIELNDYKEELKKKYENA